MTSRQHPSGTPDLARMRYVPGIDGLRALAVTSVLLYHARYAWISGGFLGVEVFFVISGYLITSLLLSERLRTGRVDLKHFYVRRARRLLPALGLVLVGAAVLALVLAPDEVASLRGDLAASLVYGTNWFFVFAQKSYFEATARPSLVQHLWSLAVEEQFYLLWPIIFTVGMRFLRRRGLLIACLIGAVASTALMILLYTPGGDPSRVYYGTDTRAAALLLGAALALVWSPWRLRREVGPGAPLLLDLIGFAALAGLVVQLLRTDEFSDSLYQGGFLRTSVLTVVVIAITAHPAAHLGRVLGARPLVWVGLRSYGLYLYHWPVYQLTRPQLDVPFDGWPLLALRLGLTVGLAELSYRFVESPIRHGAIARWRAARRVARATGRPVPGGAWLRGAAGAVAVLALLTVLVVRAQPPEVPDYLATGASTNAAGALPPGPAVTGDATGPSGTLPPGVPGAGETATGPTTGVTDPAAAATTTVPGEVPGTTGTVPGGDAATVDPLAVATVPVTPPPTTAPAPVPPPNPNRRVTALGDSVMLGAAPALQSGISGNVFVDARVGRQVSEGVTILDTWRQFGVLGDVVVIHLGNNGTFADYQFDQMAQILQGVPKVVFVNCKVPRQWEESVNATIAAGVSRMPNAVLVDWKGLTADRPELFYDDGMHLKPEGAAFYTQTIAAAIG